MELPERVRDYKVIKGIYDGNKAGKITNVVQLVEFKGKKFALKRYASEKAHRREISAYFQVAPHPNIVKFYLSFFDEERYNLVMEFVDGLSSDNRLYELNRNGSPDLVLKALQYGAKMVEIIGYSHRKGVIYRDVKPNNFIVDSGDDIKLIDFDCAVREGFSFDHIRRPKSVCQAPEQRYRNYVKRPQADIYGLGCTISILLYNAVGKSFVPLGDSSRIIPEGLDFDTADLRGLLGDMMQMNWRHRISSCDEVMERLGRCIEDVMRG